MRALRTVGLAILFVVLDLALLPVWRPRDCVGCGHFKPGSVTIPPRQPGAAPRAIPYSVGFCDYMGVPAACWPQRWNVTVSVDMQIDDASGFTLDDYEAALSIAAADVMERQLKPRFGGAAEDVRTKFLQSGSARIVQPAMIPLVGPAVLYGVPIVQIALLYRVARGKRVAPNSPLQVAA